MLRRVVSPEEGGGLAVAGDDGNRIIWFDLISPSRDEEAEIEAALGIDVPTREDIGGINPSSRLHREGDVVFAAARVITGGDTARPDTSSVAFLLRAGALLTVHYEDIRVFDVFASECLRAPRTVRSGLEVLVGLLEAIVDRNAELLETVGDAVDDLPGRIHPEGDQSYKRREAAELRALLAEIQLLQRRTAKVRESLVSLGHMIRFLLAQPEMRGGSVRARAESVAGDIASLSDHASFVTQNIQFVLDAALGLVGVEQNAIVKFFSIVAVVLLPPTLVAGIYGMNFHVMPELDWRWGYPFAILLMLASAILPYLWCRARGWL